MREFSENGFESKKKLFSRPLDLETARPPIWGGFDKSIFVTFFHSDLFWAGPAFLMYSLAEAYDVVNQRGLSKWQSKNIYSAKSIDTFITFMIQNHSITQWQRSGMNISRVTKFQQRLLRFISYWWAILILNY